MFKITLCFWFTFFKKGLKIPNHSFLSTIGSSVEDITDLELSWSLEAEEASLPTTLEEATLLDFSKSNFEIYLLEILAMATELANQFAIVVFTAAIVVMAVVIAIYMRM